MKIGKHELRLERRLAPLAGGDAAKISLVAILVGLALFSIIFILADVNPLSAYKTLFSYAFTSPYGLSATANRFVYLLLCTLAFIIPFRAGLWNIGMTGQLYFGALGAFGVLYAFTGAWAPPTPDPGVSSGLVILLMILVAALCGAGFAAIAGFLKGRFNVNEIVTTIMLNFIALWFVRYMIFGGGPFMNPGGRSESFNVPPSARLSSISVGDVSIPLTIFLAIGIAVLLYFLFTKTKLGYQIKAFGHNPTAARYSGVSPLKITLLVFIIGGMIAGLAGYHYFGGPGGSGYNKIQRNFYLIGDLAFYGIVCGLISLGNPLSAIPVSLFFGGLTTGTRYIQGQFHMAFGLDYALLGVLMILLVAFQFFSRYRIVWTKKLKGGG
ncbi:hypothetical protein AKJ44_02440 [candidate division MSBL1 archaeon SCGC-AAA261F17]|uniref:ABC transporter permease n=1 Tax=candidate division MSBL1 archaeon SCGC-AAA261F17 TaxID=1698274 RepID=A0A133V4Z6_9EURY|nr:hypothetical protein AKJ44_02440 [candidate division MSBL1 archaeon SCGC-AAA261F17]